MTRLALIFMLLLLSSCAELGSQDQASLNTGDADVCPVNLERMPVARCIQLSKQNEEAKERERAVRPAVAQTSIPTWLMDGPHDAMLSWIKGPLRLACLQAPTAGMERECLSSLVRAHLRYSEAGALAVANPARREGEPYREFAVRGGQDLIVASLEWSSVHFPAACFKAPTEAATQGCLTAADDDYRQAMDALHEYAKSQTQAKEREIDARFRAQQRQLDAQLDAQLEAARIQAAGQALMGIGMSGGIFKMPPPMPVPQLAPAPPLVLPAAPILAPPPVSCMSQKTGGVVTTNCY